MAFVRSNLHRIAGAYPSLWIYLAGADPIGTVDNSGYFNEVADEISRGDIIIVVGNNFGTINTAFFTSAKSVKPVTVSVTAGNP